LPSGSDIYGGNMFDETLSQKLATMLKSCIGMQDFSRIVHICHYVMETEHLEGDVVEFGCHEGYTARMINALTNRPVHVYDSFMGLPRAEGHGGEMSSSVESFLLTFRSYNVPIPIIHKGWFEQLTESDIPLKISFAHLDGDLKTSTESALRLIYNHLEKGAVVLIDDYGTDLWPGPKVATDEFFKDKPEKIVPLMGVKGLPSYKALIVKV